MLITITGPTASGKTRLAVQLAFRLASEVISADSRQVYQGMDLGTGKDLKDYQVGGAIVPYHLIDIIPAGEKYNLFAYQQDFHRVYADIQTRGIKYPILCGGTGLYIESILKGYNLPDVPVNEALRANLEGLSIAELKERLSSYGPLHNTTDLDSCQRAIRAIEIAEYKQKLGVEGLPTSDYPSVESLIFCLELNREERRRRISLRLKERLAEGMTSEVERLLAEGVAPESLIYYGLEYKWLTLYVMGKITYEEMTKGLEVAIHQFAKRQMTWFRGMERRGFTLHYLDALAPTDELIEQILEYLPT